VGPGDGGLFAELPGSAFESDRRVAIWLRVRLGGERMTMVAADYGCRDGSGINRVVERLVEKAKGDRALARRLKSLTEKVPRVDPRPSP